MANKFYSKGLRYERRSIEYLLKHGALWVMRAGASQGCWDLAAQYPTSCAWIQCKACEPTLADRREMWEQAKKVALGRRNRDFSMLCHIWRPQAHEPEVIEIDEAFAMHKRERVAAES